MRQKIIPDGYLEMILHYGDPYQINIDGIWRTQSKYLLAGQLTHHFYLENTGQSGMIGIKFKPAAVHDLFGLEMFRLVNKVVELFGAIGLKGQPFVDFLRTGNFDNLSDHVERLIIPLIPDAQPSKTYDAVDLIIEKKGLLSIGQITESVGISERQLERLFKRVVGLTPKRFCRIIRFAHIFKLVESGDVGWAKIALDSGFFDQSHFIKDFKAFTGEDPSRYTFNDQNMANFFMRK